MADTMNYQSCCRLCLCEDVDTLKPIFNTTTDDRDLSQKILLNLSIQINFSDKMSTMVCEGCTEKITNWNSFKEQCIQNQKKFDDLLPPPPLPSPPPLLPLLTPAPCNNTTTSLGDISFQIKEEPMTEPDPLEENPVEDVPGHLESLLYPLEQSMESPFPLILPVEHPDHSQIYVKSEPIDMDHMGEHMDHEYNDFPPTLSPHHANSSENSNDIMVDLNRNSDVNKQCSVCGKLFSSSGNKKKHERIQHGLHSALSVATPKANNGFTNGEATLSEAALSEQQKILFAMGLKLLKTNDTPIASEALSKIEMSYIEKCKAMVNMHKSLVCACHNAPHQNLKGLLSHLRALRIWFPVFTCYNCMITFTDRSTFTRHISRCSSTPLNSITKLSNLTQRSEVKTRLYQNFKCTICKFMFSFHEDFCKHVDLDHSMLQFPVHCPCGRVFENVEEYKDHVYVSCLVEYYCDICFITTKTLDDFKKHAAGVHDESEGFILLQDDNYKVRKPTMHPSPTPGVDESAILSGKRERKSSIRMPFMEDEAVDEYAIQVTPTFYTPKTDNKICPVCRKEYSSYKNMMRHYKTHKTEEKQLSSDPQEMDLEDEESFYSCPDCGGMYKTLEWKVHLTEKHQSKACGECGKFFQFKTELDQHRSVHLNLKVYRDSKTQSYKSTMISPGSDGEIMLLCEICDVMFTTKEDLKNHKLTHDLENSDDGDGDMDVDVDVGENEPPPDTARKYKCEVCEEEFLSYSGLWEHNRAKHPERKTPNVDTYPKQCKDCDKVCTTGAAYYRHRQIHEKPLPADSSANRANLLKTKKFGESGEESYHACKRCFKVFSSRYNLKNHLKSHGININPASKKIIRKAVCNVCQQVFSTNEELVKHKQESHDADETSSAELEQDDNAPLLFTCDVCVMTFSNKIALTKHKEKHLQETRNSSVFCKHCKIPFESITHLSQHMVIEHDERPRRKVVREAVPAEEYACNICYKKFQSAGALTTHIGWHKRGQNDGNTKLMKSSPVIKPNIKIKEEPSDDPKFSCATCLAELPNETALQVHILEKHRSVSAIMLIPRCNTCNKDFATQDEYETHKRLHDFLERQKQHEQKLLMQQQENPQNAQNSPGQKPKSFPCKHCNAAFSRSDTLGAHMRQFHKEHIVTEFKCHHCDRIFEKQNSLTIHLKVHEKQRIMQTPTNKPLFSCSICNMGFDLPKDLRAHTISAHPF